MLYEVITIPFLQMLNFESFHQVAYIVRILYSPALHAKGDILLDAHMRKECVILENVAYIPVSRFGVNLVLATVN